MSEISERIEFLRRLRAVRQFKPDEVPEGALADILTVARWSGSARNVQPWELIVVKDKGILKQLSECNGYAQHLAGAPLGIVLVMAGEIREQETFDEGRLSERIMLAAQAHGLGSCIGWFAGDGRTSAKRILGVPEGKVVRTALSIGYADTSATRARSKSDQTRKPLSEIVYQDFYGRSRSGS